MGFRKILQLSIYGTLAGTAYGLLVHGFQWLGLVAAGCIGLLVTLSYCSVELVAGMPKVSNSSVRNIWFIRSALYSALIAFGLLMLFFESALANIEFPGTFAEKIFAFGEWLKYGTWLLIVFYSLLAGFVSQLVYMLLTVKSGYSLHGLLSGKYRMPVEESRIFMVIGFAADALGNEPFSLRSRLLTLQEILNDMQPVMEHYGAQLYRIEDELIILNWREFPGLRHEPCISLFWETVDVLEEQRAKYRSKFACFPLLKAGLHYDNVLVTEVGAQSRELMYSGEGLSLAKASVQQCEKGASSMVVTDKFLQHVPNGLQTLSLVQPEAQQAVAFQVKRPLVLTH